MGKKTRRLTLSAVFSALTVAILYIASVWPTGQLGLVAVSSLLAAAAVIETGPASGLYVFIVSSAIGMLILPNRAAPLLYIMFFGYYPVVKSLIERAGKVFFQWLLKILVFNASLTVIWFLLRGLIFGSFGDTPGAALIYIAGNIIFVIFDYGYTKLIWFYIERVSKYMRK